MNTFHCLFNFDGHITVIRIVDNALSLRILRMASLVIKNPDPEQFLKDRYGLVGDLSPIKSQKDVQAWLDDLILNKSYPEPAV